MSGPAPLAGLTVAVTRPAAKGDQLSAELARLGAAVVDAPAIRLVPPADPAPLAGAAARLAEFDWVVATSAAGVQALSEAARAAGGGAPRRLAVVGPQTEAAAAAEGWRAELVPARFDAEGVLEALDRARIELSGARVLLPLAEGARDVLPEGLAARGARVERVVAYAAEPTTRAELAELETALAAGRVALVTFTSPSAARAVLAALGTTVLAVPAAAVGPVTGSTARELGYRLAVVAEEHTMEGLVRAITRWWEAR